MRYVFQEIAVRGTRRWTDETGKKRQQTKKFFQTLNPFNRNAAGLPKTSSEIRQEITTERDAWLTSTQHQGG